MNEPKSKLQTGFSRFRMILWGLVVVAGIVATVIYFFMPPQRPLGLTGASFQLVSTENGLFTQNDLKGTPSLVFFGYTYCPDVCPTTLAEATGWREALGLSPSQLRILFVTVDPERDTIENLKSYLSAFGSTIIGLRGNSTEMTEAAKAAFGIYSAKVEGSSPEDYLVDHTATVFMIGRDGAFEGTISYGEKADVAVAKIRRLVGI